MGLFKTIYNEKSQLVEFEVLLSEIAEQEGISFSEACAIIAREALDHVDEIPWSSSEPFYLYDYNVINGFIKNDSFSKQSIDFLKSMAFGHEYAEDTNPDLKGIYSRVDGGGSDWFYKFYFKGTEITTSLLSANVDIPPCLEKYRRSAEIRLKVKAAHEQKKALESTSAVITKESLQAEILSLQQELERIKSVVPSMLGAFRDDDPLQIAIQLRNSEWAAYDPDVRKSIPSQEALVAQIKEQYRQYDMPDIQARAIEKVACPIKR